MPRTGRFKGPPVRNHRLRLAGSARHRAYVRCLQTFGPARHFEFHLRAFFQAAIALGLYSREVHEHVFTILPLDESVTLGGVKPFHCAFFFHGNPFQLSDCVRLPARIPKKNGGTRSDSRATPGLWLTNGSESQMPNHYNQRSGAQINANRAFPGSKIVRHFASSFEFQTRRYT